MAPFRLSSESVCASAGAASSISPRKSVIWRMASIPFGDRNGLAVLIDNKFRILALPHDLPQAGRLFAAVIKDAAGRHGHRATLRQRLHAGGVVTGAAAEIPMAFQNDE